MFSVRLRAWFVIAAKHVNIPKCKRSTVRRFFNAILRESAMRVACECVTSPFLSVVLRTSRGHLSCGWYMFVRSVQTTVPFSLSQHKPKYTSRGTATVCSVLSQTNGNSSTKKTGTTVERVHECHVVSAPLGLESLSLTRSFAIGWSGSWRDCGAHYQIMRG